MLKPPVPFTCMLCASMFWLRPVKMSVVLPVVIEALAVRDTCAPLRKTFAAETLLMTGCSLA